MLAALDEINQTFTQEGKPALAMGVGLNTGMMSVGNMGSSFRMAYTVMGDNVNLGSRLEGLTRAYGVSVLVSETTAQQVPQWCCRRLDKVRVKGRAAPLWVLEPLGKWAELSDAQRAWQAAFEQAVELYQARALRMRRRRSMPWIILRTRLRSCTCSALATLRRTHPARLGRGMDTYR